MKNPLPNSRYPIKDRAGDKLEGQVDHITYANEETGYTVARVNVSGFLEPVTIVGNLTALAPGEVLEMEGAWQNHPKFGRQFKVLSHRSVLPATVKGIKRYLGSGLIKGIGKEMASRIVKKFGEKTLEVIDERIEELASIEGIGRKRVEMIKRAWADQKEIRAIMIFLQDHGVGLGHAIKIFKEYGQRSVAVVTQNPYKLATDIAGVGFQTADNIAGKLGFEKTSPLRAEAGILFVLNRLSEEGHVYYPYDMLVEKCRDILEVDRETIVKGFGAIALDKRIVVEDLNQDMDGFEPNQKAVYLVRFHVSESGIARHLSRLISSKKNVRSMETEKALPWVQKKMNVRLAPKQIDAVK